MTYHNAKIRSATTAIAAVLALSSTPLFAQDTLAPDPADTVTEPVTPAPDPLAPEPTATEPTATEPAAVTETASPPAKAVKPAARAKAAAPRPAAPARPTVTRSSAATTTAPAATAAPTATEAIEAPVAPPIEAAPPPAPAPAPADTAALDQALQMDTMLEVAGAGLLALLAGGVALRSRKRRKEEERIEEAKWAYIEASPEADPEIVREPAFARNAAPKHDPVPAASAAIAGAPATKLPNGFDLSRFGPHVQAAYRGPTPDNPSLSLKYRLRRASALDQQERKAASEAATRQATQAPAKPAWTPPTQPMRKEAKFMLRRAGTNNGAKPVFQR